MSRATSFYVVNSMAGSAFFDDLEAVAQAFGPAVVYGYYPPSTTLREDAFVQRDPVFWDCPQAAWILPVYAERPGPEDVPCPIAIIVRVRPRET